MKLVNVEKLHKSIDNELEEIRGLIEMNENLMEPLDVSSEEYIQLTRRQNKLRGRHRGLRQAKSIAEEIAVEL